MFLNKHFSKAFLLIFLGTLCVCFYFLWTPFYYFRIPVDLESNPISAHVQVDIDSNSYDMELDLGAQHCALYAEHLNRIPKRYCGSMPGLDIRGNKYNDPFYSVTKVKLGNLVVSELNVFEESPEFMAQSIICRQDGKTLEEEIYDCSGRAGREIFDGKNFFLDFARSRIILCKNFNNLSRDHYRLDNFVKVPIEINKIGICFQIETDTGTKVLLLDSGASHTLLRASSVEMNLTTDICHNMPVWHSKKFVLNGHDFGEKDLYLFEISSKIKGIDGMLGLDFLKEHAVYIDMKRSIAYLAKASAAL